MVLLTFFLLCNSHFLCIFALAIVLGGMTEQYFLSTGRDAWRRQDWQTAINCYEEAIRLNPQSEAVELKKMALGVLDFYNRDMLNP